MQCISHELICTIDKKWVYKYYLSVIMIIALLCSMIVLDFAHTEPRL